MAGEVINQVFLADGRVLMSVTDTTATPETVQNGRVFYASSGARSVGTMNIKLDEDAAYPEYDDSESYSAGDICTHDGKIYVCDGATAGVWDEAKWTEKTLEEFLDEKVDKESGKGLSTNDFTTAEKEKLAGIAEGATANIGTITGITMNGASKGTSGVVDLGTVITEHQDISGKVDKVEGKGLSTNDYTDAEKTKLAGVAEGATANVGTITGITMNGASKGTSGVVDLGTVITQHQDISGKVDVSEKGEANGIAELDENGKVPAAQLPGFVDDVVDGYYYNNKFYKESTHETEIPGEAGKVYIDVSTNITYRWSGSTFVPIGSDLALGETSSTAYRGDRGAAAYAAAVTNVDTTPTEGSTHLITSGGVAAAIPDISTKADKSDTVLDTTLSLGRKANTTIGENSIALGYEVEASGDTAYAEGIRTIAEGKGSHAEGTQTGAYGAYSHAEGVGTTANAPHSHAEGNTTRALGRYSHAEGYYTNVSGSSSHVEGQRTIASGACSHVSGIYNVEDNFSNWPEWTPNTSYVSGDKVKRTVDSTITGYICKTDNSDSTFTLSNWINTSGRMNYAEIIGNGMDDNNRSNARALDWDGNERLKGNIYVGCNADSTGGTKVATTTDLSAKADKTDTVLYTTLSRGRKANTTIGTASFAFGDNVEASGNVSHAEGSATTASGLGSHAEGQVSTASGAQSHAEGAGTTASGVCSHAEGGSTTASGLYSHSEGGGTTSSNSYSHSEGYGGTYTISGTTYTSGAKGIADHTEGYQCLTTAFDSPGHHAEGFQTRATGGSSHAEGYNTTASGDKSHSEGKDTVSSGFTAHAEGLSTTASGQAAHSEGQGGTYTLNGTTYTSGAKGTADHAEGFQCLTEQNMPGNHAEGYWTRATGGGAHSEGQQTVASGLASHAEGNGTTASGTNSHAEGDGTTASGTGSHAEGGGTTASAFQSHAEGSGTTASGTQSHAEGIGGTYTMSGTTYTSGAKGTADHSEGYQCLTESNMPGNHAEGYQTRATGGGAHSEGYWTLASGLASHAEGNGTVASKNYSHAEGQQTVAAGTNSHVSGQFNVEDSYSNWPEWVANTSYSVGDKVKRTSGSSVSGYICKTANSDSTFTSSKWTAQNGKMNYAEIIGNGLDANNKSNARALDWDGNERLKGNIYVGCNADSTGGTMLTPPVAMTGATSSSAGTAGYVPTPAAGDDEKFLRGDGTWADAGGSGSLPSVSDSDNGKVLQVSNGEWSVEDAISGFYTKPTTGIPASDLASGVIPDVSGFYTKPSGGIPNSDLATPPAVMTGATSSAAGTAGYAPAPATTDVDKFLAGDGTYKSGGKPMVVLSYGNSTWNDFINAYNNNVIVYCRASSGSDPSSGSQTRMAFMAYVSDATNPTNVEFQYYRSMNSHSATAMGDEVYVYKLTSANGGTWSVTTRKASIKEIAVASGSKLGVSWSSDKVTLSNTMTADDMPMSSTDATTTKAAIESLANDIPTKLSDLNNDEGFITDSDIAGKADKVSNATNGNFAGIDADGNLTDSGHSHSDYLTQHQDISGKADKVSSATNGNFAGLDANGNLTDSGKSASDFATKAEGVTDITRSGTTFTVTRADGTTFTFTQQDNNTTYSQISRGSGAGLAPGLPSGSTTTKYLREDGTWQVPPDNNTTYSAASGGGLSLSGTAFSLANSGATAGSYGPSANATPGYGATFNVPYITIDAKGRVTAASTKTVKIPASDNTNTWRGIQNNLTSTSTTDSLSAAQGKALYDAIVLMGYNKDYVRSKSTGSNYVQVRSVNNTLELTAFLGNNTTYLSLALNTGGMAAYYVVNGTTNKSRSVFTW